jgi:recombinational DNA repair ATPase RecF
MARGYRRSIDDEISKVDIQIEKCSQELINLQEQRKQLLKQKEQADLETLYNFIKKSGKSISEFISELSPSQESA